MKNNSFAIQQRCLNVEFIQFLSRFEQYDNMIIVLAKQNFNKISMQENIKIDIKKIL